MKLVSRILLLATVMAAFAAPQAALGANAADQKGEKHGKIIWGE